MGLLSCLLRSHLLARTQPPHTLVMSGKEVRNGKEMKGGKSKRSAETESEETDDAKRKKVEQPAGNLLVTEEGFTNVFSDGQCIFLGKSGQKVGLGVWWAEDHPLNCSQKGGGQKWLPRRGSRSCSSTPRTSSWSTRPGGSRAGRRRAGSQPREIL